MIRCFLIFLCLLCCSADSSAHDEGFSTNFKGPANRTATLSGKESLAARILAGDLGPATNEEELMMARELLAMGRSLNQPDLEAEIENLKMAYDTATTDATRRHLQISALFLLRGQGLLQRDDAKWYYAGFAEDDDPLQKIESTIFRFSSARSPSPSPEQKIQRYVRDSRILTLYAGAEKEEMAKAMAEALTKYVNQNGGKWPGTDQLKVNEQFFWNFYDPLLFSPDLYDVAYNRNLELVKQLFSKPIRGDWNTFQAFFNLFLQGPSAHRRNICLISLFQALAPEDRAPFMAFCEPFLNRVPLYKQPDIMAQLLPIFQAYPTPENRAPFMAFCKPFLKCAHLYEQLASMAQFLPIFQAYPTLESRAPFIEFCALILQPFCRQLRKSQVSVLIKL